MSRMSWVVLVVLVGTAVVMGMATPPAAAADYPSVAGLQPFAAETNYMSLAGYLRWLVFEKEGVWLSVPEAKRIVAEQQG